MIVNIYKKRNSVSGSDELLGAYASPHFFKWFTGMWESRNPDKPYIDQPIELTKSNIKLLMQFEGDASLLYLHKVLPKNDGGAYYNTVDFANNIAYRLSKYLTKPDKTIYIKLSNKKGDSY